MEHEVFVPVPVQRLEETLADPVRVARAVPGLQQDAGAEPVSGRLKVRVGSHSVTYRGAVRVSGRDDGSYAVEGDATETRGTGSVKLALTLRVREAEGGCTLTFEGTAAADGRVTELPANAVGAAVTRLLNRFAENLVGVAGEERPAGRTEQGESVGSVDVDVDAGSGSGDDSPEVEVSEPLVTQEFEAKATSDFETTPDADDAPAPEPASVFDTEVPPPALDPPAEEGEEGDMGGEDEEVADAQEAEKVEEDEGEAVAAVGAGAGAFAEPAAEAAHARRTMIGRSAEEVDHAPPRGRYAPVPAPQTVSQGSALRWAAPAAAVVLASAIVVGRVLRRRR